MNNTNFKKSYIMPLVIAIAVILAGGVIYYLKGGSSIDFDRNIVDVREIAVSESPQINYYLSGNIIYSLSGNGMDNGTVDSTHHICCELPVQPSAIKQSILTKEDSNKEMFFLIDIPMAVHKENSPVSFGLHVDNIKPGIGVIFDQNKKITKEIRLFDGSHSGIDILFEPAFVNNKMLVFSYFTESPKGSRKLTIAQLNLDNPEKIEVITGDRSYYGRYRLESYNTNTSLFFYNVGVTSGLHWDGKPPKYTYLRYYGVAYPDGINFGSFQHKYSGDYLREGIVGSAFIDNNTFDIAIKFEGSPEKRYRVTMKNPTNTVSINN